MMARFGLGARKFSWTGTVCSVLRGTDSEPNYGLIKVSFTWGHLISSGIRVRVTEGTPGLWLSGPISILLELIFIPSPLEKFCEEHNILNKILNLSNTRKFTM